MDWITILWAMMAAVSSTIAAVYLLVWLKQRDAWAYLMFVLLALSIVGIAATEVWMMRSQTPEGFGTALRWFQVPIWSGFLAVVGLVYFQLRPRFIWMGCGALGLRTVALIANFGPAPNLNYLALTEIEHSTLLGEPVATVTGIPNPWMLIGQASLIMLALFILDGGVSAWRRGEGGRTMALAGTLFVLVVAGTAQAILAFWGLFQFPLLSTPLFMGIAAVMGFELGTGMLRAARAERALRVKDAALSLSEQRLSLAAEAADAGLWSLDTASGKVWTTAKTREIFGLGPDEDLRLQDLFDRVRDQDRLRLSRVVDQALRSGEKFRVEFRILHPDGSTRWLLSVGRCRAAFGGGTETLMGVTADVTARKAAEDEARRQRAQLDHLSTVATLSELSASLAHELNQPLAMILTNAEAAQTVLAQDSPDLTEVSDILADIVRADRRATDVIRRLRALLQRGEPHREDLVLNDAISEVLEVLRSELEDQGVTVDLIADPDLPAVPADRILIEQVLLNLLTNACEAVAANTPGERRVALVIRADADAVLAEMTDNGCGVPDRERIFEAFYTTKPGGLGMGLAIVRSIVSSHGGRVWAESASGRGTTFCFSLPRASADS